MQDEHCTFYIYPLYFPLAIMSARVEFPSSVVSALFPVTDEEQKSVSLIYGILYRTM